MRESELVMYYGLSVGSGLALALTVYAISEYLRHPSKIAVFAWLDPSAAERPQLSIFVDNQTRFRTVIHEAGAILEDGRRISVTERIAPHSGKPAKAFPITVAARENTTVSIFSISRHDVSVGLAACYVIRDSKKFITGPVYGQLE